MFPFSVTAGSFRKQAWPGHLAQKAGTKKGRPFNNCFQQIVTEPPLWPRPNIMSLEAVCGIWRVKLISKADPNKYIKNRVQPEQPKEITWKGDAREAADKSPQTKGDLQKFGR